MADLAGEAPDPPEQLLGEDHPAADADLTGDVDEVGQVVVAAEPQLAERGQVGLVVDHHRKVVAGQVVGQDPGHGHVHPPEVRGQPEQPAVGLDRAGHGHGQPGDGEPLGLGPGEGGPDHAHGPAEHLGRGLGPVVPRPGPEIADLADQVGQAHGDVVDVDLQPDPGVAAGVDREGAARAADLAPGLGAQLDHQAGADQVVDQAGDGRLGQAGGAGDAGPGDRVAGRDVPEHQGQVVRAERILPGRRPPRPQQALPRLSCARNPLYRASIDMEIPPP